MSVTVTAELPLVVSHTHSLTCPASVMPNHITFATFAHCVRIQHKRKGITEQVCALITSIALQRANYYSTAYPANQSGDYHL